MTCSLDNQCIMGYHSGSSQAYNVSCGLDGGATKDGEDNEPYAVLREESQDPAEPSVA